MNGISIFNIQKWMNNMWDLLLDLNLEKKYTKLHKYIQISTQNKFYPAYWKMNQNLMGKPGTVSIYSFSIITTKTVCFTFLKPPYFNILVILPQISRIYILL